ncbi:MAG: hydroxymethylglutaryl-CoA reductase [Candidatus Thorarchaeota archaeon]|nr:MAG: hydroxymethylglutaryl-CoA reductase [Candidatus Thorarchaeota archaeon]
MQIPTFLLRKLYVKGSLENVDDGFQFKIKNSLSKATVTGVDPIKVDGKEYPLDATVVASGGNEVAGNEISEENSFPIEVGVEVTIRIKGEQLSPSEHTIDIGLATVQAGNLSFDVKDTI